MPVHTLDLNFLGNPGVIASYLIPHPHGAVLIESGPGSTVLALQAALRSHGLTSADITDVLLTHIHLDHGGAAGWFARQGARIHVHPFGAPHLIDPEKLLTSASRIYGDQMHLLWGEFLTVPEERVHIVQDGEEVEIEGLHFTAIDTPGHANHHFSYLFNDICFSGDIGGIRMQTVNHLRLPMPPPEFIPELWHSSLDRLLHEYQSGSFTHLAPTHYGIFADAGWHLTKLKQTLNEIETWIQIVMLENPSLEQLNHQFLEWTRQYSLRDGLDVETSALYEAANPSWMSSQGILRYWNKYRGTARNKEIK
jgi:glyoxylase-like metal-dependent hydrolase (beta-lactamase superfamily II)